MLRRLVISVFGNCLGDEVISVLDNGLGDEVISVLDNGLGDEVISVLDNGFGSGMIVVTFVFCSSCLTDYISTSGLYIFISYQF